MKTIKTLPGNQRWDTVELLERDYSDLRFVVKGIDQQGPMTLGEFKSKTVALDRLVRASQE